jgi:hypothetical protein
VGLLQLLEFSADFFNLLSEEVDPGVTITLDFIHSDDLTFVQLSLFLQSFIFFLKLLTLVLILIFNFNIFLE